LDTFAGERSLEKRVVRPARSTPFSPSFRLLDLLALRPGLVVWLGVGFVVCFGVGLVCFGVGFVVCVGVGLVCVDVGFVGFGFVVWFGVGLVGFSVALGLTVLVKLGLTVLLKLGPVVRAGTVGRVLLDELSHEAPARPSRHAPDGDQRRPDGQATPRRKAVLLLGRFVS
jgi:hypothetical protein